VIAASVAIIVIGAVQTAIELLLPINPSAPPTVETPDGTATPGAPRRTMPTPQGAVPQPPAADPRPTGQIPRTPSFFDPSTVVAPKPPPADVTGSIGRPTATEHPPIPVARPTGRAAPAAPATATSATLSAALSRNDPAAAYEMGARHAEGRDGVRQDLQEAARWLERAASAGFAPAQFRLAGLNEKGEGLKKDLQAARRLYIAAASKGHAKAMHNLAVLYAEGIDGKPDYRVAAQWFRKAAAFGIADSQYNLAILYARGIGVETNLAESYKWFALAAAKGDRDAAQKRDEVAARLDRQTLMAAKLAVQTFVAEQEPEEAISLRAPPGGWDRAQPHTAKAQPRKPRRQHRE
jgi:localization factor PodJL